ncbi:MAG TPA: metal-sensitive transcriptional regulator [Acidimicrobiales bacterium]|jgi:DNA-binding FrmR family transcriptional regulator
MAPTDVAHVLQDEEQVLAITKRLKRAHGQMGAVVRMLEEGRSCEDVVMQMAAVGKAINTAAFTLISASLKECIADPAIDSDQVTEKLQKLFLSLA